MFLAGKHRERDASGCKNAMAEGASRSGKSGVFRWILPGVLPVFLLFFFLLKRGVGLPLLLYGTGAFLIIIRVLFRIATRDDREKLRLIWPDVVLVVLWYAMLFIPLGRIERKVSSETEKRKLAEHKPFILEDGTVNRSYFKDFDTWFNDRFCGREALIKLNSSLMRPLYLNFFLHTYKNVYTGLSGWYFYSENGGLRNYHNLDLFSDGDLSKAADDLKKIQSICAQRNKKLYVLICPDKNKVYGEFFPGAPKIRPDSESRARQVERCLRQNGIPVIYPLDALLEKKGDDILYRKTDTHWNAMGAYIGYLALMKRIREDCPDIPLCEIQSVGKEQRPEGDLADMCPGMIGKDATWYPVPRFRKNYTGLEERIDAPGHGCWLVNPHEKYRLLILRDSFASALIPYLANSFRSVNAHWSHQLKAERVEDLQESDILIFECVERYLPSLLNGIHQTRILLEGGSE